MNKKKTALLLTLICIAILAFSACAVKEDPSPVESEPGVVNPLQEYETIDDLNDILGFDMVTPPNLDSYGKVVYTTIDSDIGQIILTGGKNGLNMTIRQQKGSGDISGVYGATDQQQKELNGLTVTLSTLENVYVATWENGGYTYSISAEAEDKTAFDTTVEEITALTVPKQ